MIRTQEALEYHATRPRGKVELRPTKPCITPREMRLAYLPGASYTAGAIAQDEDAVYEFTAKGNLVGIITDGSAIPGVGNGGPGAAKPMQEGTAVLFKQLADIDVFDLELAAEDPERLIDTVLALEPTFGGISLKDVVAPRGIMIYERLREMLRIPILHENLYATAVVAVAALINAIDLAGKRIEDIRVVLCGAGTVGIGCARLLFRLGLPRERLTAYDVHGLLDPGRRDLNAYQEELVRERSPRDLPRGLAGADVFIGASTGGVLAPEMLHDMARYPLVLALASPSPEIDYELARSVRRDVMVATSMGQYPNTVLDLLSFPYVFRGALDVRSARITEDMLLAAARALAELAREEVPEEVERAYGRGHFTFGPEYLLPKPVDPRILLRESAAVAEQAVRDGLAGVPVDRPTYEESLSVRLGTGRETLRAILTKARRVPRRVVFPEGTSETVLRAVRILVEEGIVSPILLGREEEIRSRASDIGLDLGDAVIQDPAGSPRLDAYVEEYFRLRGRRGVLLATARERLNHPDRFAAFMVHSGDADMMVAGTAAHYAESLRAILEVIGTAPGVRRVTSLYMVLLGTEVYFMADCAVNVEPDAEVVAETALLTARLVRSLGIDPRVAMLSFSNFGSVDHPHARRMREACRIAREEDPELVIDGEMQLTSALDGDLRRCQFPFSVLDRDANVLIFPGLESGRLALEMLERLADSVAIGPLLLGTRLPVHLTQYGSTVDNLVHLTALGTVEAASRNPLSLPGGGRP